MLTNQKLLPCPFCGGEATWGHRDCYDGLYHYCPKCEAEVPGDAANWNRRASPQPANPAQVTDAMVETAAEIYFQARAKKNSSDAMREALESVTYAPVPIATDAMVKAIKAKWAAMRQLGDPNEHALASAAIAAIGAGGQAVAEPRKGFPILGSGGQTIDWQLVADHGKQAQANHYQSVERLAARGGLAWTELYAVLHNKKWQKMDENDAIAACRSLEARYLSALSQPHPADERVRRGMDEILKKAIGARHSVCPSVRKGGPVDG